MRFAWVLAIGALSACVSVGGVPAKTGMTVNQHAATCTDGGRQIVSELIGVLVGECTAKPDEYVVFTRGKVSNIYTADEIADAMLAACPAQHMAKCENAIRQEIAERTEIKRSIAANLLNAKNQRIGAALSQLGSSLQAMDSYGLSDPAPAAPAFAPPPAPSGSCRFNPATGRNQLCHTVDATGRCFAWGTGC